MGDKSFIGEITTYAHGVSGDIYSCGDDKIIFENFKYDGLGPDAFFWVGTEGAKPSSNGILLPYPFEGKFYDYEDLNAPFLDKAYDGTQSPMVVTLPDDVTLSDLKWISVWCRKVGVNFGDYIFEETCDVKDKSYIGAIVPYEHEVSGDIYSCGEKKIIFENFKYDGLGPDAFFWVGTEGAKPSSNGILLPYPFEGKFYDYEDLNAPF